MAAHTYWRLYIGAIQNTYAQIGTVSFLNAAQANQSTGGTATASSEYGSPWAADNAFDGNPTSEWASAGVASSEWIAYQHPSPVDIAFVGVKVAPLYPISGLALQYSDDGVSWSAAAPLYLLPGQPELTSGSYTILGLLGLSASRRPLVVVNGQISELHDGDTLPAAVVPPVVAAEINAATSKTTPVDADELGLSDSAASWGLKKLTFANLAAWVRSIALTGLSTATNAVITASDTVIGALGKLQKQISDHLAKTTGAHAASAVSNTPSGGISATTVQAAINELDSEKFAKTGGNVSGNLRVTSGVLGYGAGAGGTVTQTTSKSTAVTLNKPCGQITMHPAEMGTGAVGFTLNNSLLGDADGVIVTPTGPFTNYAVEVAYYPTTTSVVLRVRNFGVARSDALIINFMLIKGSLS